MSKKELLDLLEGLDFPHQGRDNIRRDKTKAPQGIVLGKIKNREYTQKEFNKGAIDDSNTTKREKYKEIHRVAKELMRRHNPNFKFTSIQVNKNNRTAKHTDANNVGVSYMIGLGDYTGGDLEIFDEDGNNPKSYPTKNRWIKFNGSIYPHQTKPFKGNRYTLVYYDIIKK